TLCWQPLDRSKPVIPEGAVGFSQFTTMFDEKLEKHILETVSSELKRTLSALKDLEAISKPDLIKAVILFENQTMLAIRILQQANKARVPANVFLKVLELAKKLANARFEGRPITTAFVVMTDQDVKTHNVEIGAPLDVDLLSLPFKDILSKAIKVDG